MLSPSALSKLLLDAAAKIEFRLHGLQHLSSLLEPYTPAAEISFSSEVDQVCRALADHLGCSARRRLFPRMDFLLVELVLWRVRDAQRRLAGEIRPAFQSSASDADAIRHLLVEGWHTYAEPYWLERLARSGLHVETAGAGRPG